MRRTMLIATLAMVGWGLLPTVSGVAQDAAVTCAGHTWLEAVNAAPDASVATPDAARMPAWMMTELTDACSGNAFTLAQFAGKTLYVESMATWCGECYEQLSRVQEAYLKIPESERADIVLVALSSEVDLPREDLAAYAEKTGFPLLFAVMPEAMLKTMVNDIGREWAIPPAMPHLIVAPDGTVGELHTGGSSVAALLDMFAAAQPNAS